MMLLMSSGRESFAQGIQFTGRQLGHNLEERPTEKRLVFIDIYTSWYGPYKKNGEENLSLKK